MFVEGGVSYTNSNGLSSSAVGQEIYRQTGGALVVSAEKSTFEATAPDNNIAVYFDVITDHSINIQNQISDNWLENNTSVQDAIAQSPITITLSGISSELVYIPSTKDKRFLRNVYESINNQLKGLTDNTPLRNYVMTDKLTVIPELLPPVDNVTQAAKNLVTQVEDNIARYQKIAKNFLRKVNNETRLQEIYNKLISLRETNSELIVETPFKTFESMYIQSVSLTQGEQNHIVNISMTLKQLNFTDIEVTKANQDVLAKYNAIQRAPVENHGKVIGKTVDASTIIGGWSGKFAKTRNEVLNKKDRLKIK